MDALVAATTLNNDCFPWHTASASMLLPCNNVHDGVEGIFQIIYEALAMPHKDGTASTTSEASKVLLTPKIYMAIRFKMRKARSAAICQITPATAKLKNRELSFQDR
ncbi:hypothetical protein AC578_5813 [Pseudocercospora eumusae]|uniref:Uncharacterized protein n=1 Tax=Pseudocercospora eumusae TaxID=321146 RepID=A0A139HCD0_9PEZI|nr:hypothetical protein AC578_5813 [Pseudocercospora eumusae]